MPDHVHVLIQLEQDELGRLVARIKSHTAREVNLLRGTNTPVWAKGYYDRALREEDQLKDVARYIVANPVRAGLVKSVRDYPYWDAIWL